MIDSNVVPAKFLFHGAMIKIPNNAVLQALTEIGHPVTMKMLGDHMGLLGKCTGWRCQDHDAKGRCFNLSHRAFKRGPRGYADVALTATIRRLRNFGYVVKLPFEGAAGYCVTYAKCDNYEHGVRLQAAACLAMLAEVPEHMHKEIKYRRLRTALDGLTKSGGEG